MDEELIEVITSSAWQMSVLAAVRDTALPQAWVEAGVLRDLVWGQRYGPGFQAELVRDVATAVAVRLTTTTAIEICAPHGLHDLLCGVWRRNPARFTIAQSLAQLTRHHPVERWPHVTVIPPA